MPSAGKQSGLGDNFWVSGFDLTGDTASIDNLSSPMSPLDTTGLDKSGHERIGGKRDGMMSFTNYFNPSAGQAHPVLDALPTADVLLTYARGTVLGNPAASMVAKQIGYDGKRGNDGSFLFTTQAQANAWGLDWGLQLTAGKRTDTVATLGTGVDFGAAASFGFQAYLQVFSFVGTDVTVKLQDSADNVTFADVASGAFTQLTVTAPPGQWQRLAVGGTATLREFVRATTVTTGGFTSLVFAVAVTQNTLAFAA